MPKDAAVRLNQGDLVSREAVCLSPIREGTRRLRGEAGTRAPVLGGPKAGQREIIDAVTKQNPEGVFQGYLTDGGGITDAAKEGLPVYEFNSQNARKQSECLQQIVTEFVSRIQ